MNTSMENTKRTSKTAITSIKMICITALFMALTCIATMVIQIPIPLGYAHLGDCVILISAYFFGPIVGALASGIGSMMADILTGYPIWALPTLFIKTLMPLISCLIMGTLFAKNKRPKFFSFRTILAAVATLLFMVVGYVLFGALLYGGLAAGLASAPGLCIKAVVNLIVFLVVGKVLDASVFRKMN